jgi:hypothetical protein
MGLLRGYGNAIVPQVAEVFVRAWMDCRANSATVNGNCIQIEGEWRNYGS